MAKVILVLYEPLLNLEDKILSFEDNFYIRIGRSHGHEDVTHNNGLLPNNLFAVSYQHANLSFTDGQFLLQDTSRNGTFINGYRIRKNTSHSLTSGDVLQLSQETFSSIRNINIPTFFVKLLKESEQNYQYFTLLEKSYDCPLQLYHTAPNFEVSLEMLHSCTRERFEALQVLDKISNTNFIHKQNMLDFLASLKDTFINDLMKLILGTSTSYEEEYNLQKMDHISHYILCLSCCQNFVIKKWFIDQEIKLLQIRWYFLTNGEKRKVINKYFSRYRKLQEKEKEQIINNSCNYLDRDSEYYEIPFLEISKLISLRSVFLQNGNCFVPLDDVVYAIITSFIKTMKINLEVLQMLLDGIGSKKNVKLFGVITETLPEKFMHKKIHRVWHDERISSIISYIKKEIQFERFLFDDRSSSVVLADIDKLAKESFPLCMSILHYNLKKHKHLKNGGRLQYGLFLKAIGLSLQDSLTFWRYYFTKKISLDDFIKNYQYHIMHSYGAVGKMADYPPHSCKKILKAAPTFGEYHGCPFKVLQEEEIMSILAGNHIIAEEGARDIVELMKKEMPQLACKKYFELCHGVTLNESPYHPNKYFEMSQNVRKGITSRNCSCQKNDDW